TWPPNCVAVSTVSCGRRRLGRPAAEARTILGAGRERSDMDKVIAAAVQATPVFLDREATVEKSVRLIAEAAANGAGLIVFPETFIPTYPDWVWRAGVWDEASGELYGRLLENAVEVPSPVTDTRGRAARRARAYLSM